MKVITESFLRATFRKSIPETFMVEAGQILTPSAVQLLSEKGVKIVRDNDKAVSEAPKALETPEQKPVHKYVSALDGGLFETKPEHMTALNGNRLVSKDHPTILFRGKLDSLQSMILLAQNKAHDSGRKKLTEDLNDVLEQVRAIMKADVLDEALPERIIIGLTDAELRKQSHNPEKYFGTGHLVLAFDMGETILSLNELRSSVREVEVVAVNAFRSEFELAKSDILQALNRMSSAIYIMMLKEKAGKYR